MGILAPIHPSFFARSVAIRHASVMNCWSSLRPGDFHLEFFTVYGVQHKAGETKLMGCLDQGD